MAIDFENLGPAPDISNFDAGSMDRGDSLVTDPVDEPKDEEVQKLVDEVNKEAPKDEPKDEEPADEPEDEEPKDEPTDEKDEEKPRDKNGRFEAKIPKSRFDEAVGKEREAREAAERRAAELERQLKAGEQEAARTVEIEKIESEIASLEEKHAELLLDGKGKEAAAVMKDIRMAERRIATAEAEARATVRINQTLEKRSYDAVVARVEADFPQFNPDSEAYDEDLVALVLSKQQALVSQQGMSQSQAMEKAAKDVAERFIKVDEPPKDEEKPKGLSANKVVEDRKAAQLAKNIDTMKKQPASLKEVGIDSDKAGKISEIDVNGMTAEELAALPPSTLAKLRGDFV